MHRHPHRHPPFPITFDAIISHMIADHGQHFEVIEMKDPPSNEALEYQLEVHDRLHQANPTTPHPGGHNDRNHS
jgi:hypothetical protein